MKTIMFWIWVYRSWRLFRIVKIDMSLKEIINLCKEMSWMLDLSSIKVEAE